MAAHNVSVFGCKLTGGMAKCNCRLIINGKEQNNTVRCQVALCDNGSPEDCSYSTKAELVVEAEA